MSTLTPAQAWLLAARPRTLTLAVATITVGTCLAGATGNVNLPVAILCYLTAILLQILSNFANDYGDSQHGADSSQRTGPKRAVQAGLISAKQMKRAMLICAVLCAVSGLLMVGLAFGTQGLGLVLLFVVLGGAAVGAAILYTNGQNPYGYVGLGDLFVLIFFGWVAVLGSYYLHVQSFDWLILLPATSCGLFSVAVLNVNNIRDIESDRAAGKNSIPVRLGSEHARLYHWALLIIGLVTAILYIIFTNGDLGAWLFLLSTPLLLKNGLAVQKGQTTAELDPLLKQMSLSTLAFSLLFGIGQLL